MKTVCFFGIYDPEYSRNRVLIQGFKENGWNVIECRIDPKQNPGFSKYRKLKALRRAITIDPDIIIAAFPGQPVMWLARSLFPTSKIVFDAFTSLYDSNVYDRELYDRLSIRGIRDYILDWTALHLAHLIITDTDAHADFFSKTFNVRRSKIIRVFVGSAASMINNVAPSELGRFTIQFNGYFIPLQGIEYIIQAASLLRDQTDIEFRIIGDGQQHEKILALNEKLGNRNVSFMARMPFSQLMQQVASASIVLGIFGTTPKAARVIPNKVYEAIANGKAVITEDSSAAKELLTDEKTALLIPAGDPKALVDAILRLKADARLRSELEKNARILFEERLTPKTVVADLIQFL